MIGKKSSLFLLSGVLIGILFSVFSVFYTGKYRSGKESGSGRRNQAVIAIEKALPAVVNISTERILHPYRRAGQSVHTDPMGELFDGFLRSQTREKSYSLGSGFVIDPSGLVVTNAHVVERATRVVITLHNGKNYEAQILTGDPLNDVALLKIKDPPPDLQSIRRPCSKKLYLGETVIAVGNPFGLGSSIAVGALSGEQRKFVLQDKVIFSDILQTDAIVYPGNSGGPLINIDGEVIGMNMSAYQNAPGIGFAIPFHRVENVLASWMLPERFSDSSLGVVPACDKNGNIIVSKIRKGTEAERFGIKAGGRINAFNDREVTDLLSLSQQLIRIRSGQTVALTVDGKRYQWRVTQEKELDPVREAERKLSLRLTPLTERLAKELSYPVTGGMIASEPLHGAGALVQRGDLLIQLGKSVINSPSDLAKALQELHYNDTVRAVFLSPVTIADRKYMTRRAVVLRVR